eukprot:TRINITY_DN13346_c0_g1_i1.p1 TRINITY_DN13346_c0_g1~~TRINITY_DN13346_c0_g1_i1.p1  ORF type:complete len:554 (+),score=131.82 TRINITY_DN13346_c0_g1_i1:181-1662(+)
MTAGVTGKFLEAAAGAAPRIPGPIGAAAAGPDRRRRVPNMTATKESDSSSVLQHVQLPIGQQVAPSDACSVSDMSSQIGSPRASETDNTGTEATDKKALLTLPVPRREAVSWCDMRDEDDDELDFEDCSPTSWAPMSPSVNEAQSETPSKNARKNRKNGKKKAFKDVPATSTGREYNNDCLPQNLDSLFQQQQPQQQQQQPQAPQGQLAHGQNPAAVVTIGDIMPGANVGVAHGAEAPRVTGDASNRTPDACWMGMNQMAGMPSMGMASSPCRAQAGPCGLFGTSPLANAERARPQPVMLPMGAVFQSGPSPSAAMSPQAAGDASTRTMFLGGSPTACGDASTRTLPPGAASPAQLLQSAAAASPSPKAAYSGTDASCRTPMGCSPMSWPNAAVHAACAEAASPARHRMRLPMRMPNDSPGGCNIVSTSPTSAGGYNPLAMGWSPMSPGPAAPASSPEQDTLRMLVGHGHYNLPSGQELAARLAAAAPEAYED